MFIKNKGVWVYWEKVQGCCHIQKQSPNVFYKKGVLINSVKFIRVRNLLSVNLLKSDSGKAVSCEFCEILQKLKHLFYRTPCQWQCFRRQQKTGPLSWLRKRFECFSRKIYTSLIFRICSLKKKGNKHPTFKKFIIDETSRNKPNWFSADLPYEKAFDNFMSKYFEKQW